MRPQVQILSARPVFLKWIVRDYFLPYTLGMQPEYPRSFYSFREPEPKGLRKLIALVRLYRGGGIPKPKYHLLEEVGQRRWGSYSRMKDITAMNADAEKARQAGVPYQHKDRWMSIRKLSDVRMIVESAPESYAFLNEVDQRVVVKSEAHYAEYRSKQVLTHPTGVKVSKPPATSHDKRHSVSNSSGMAAARSVSITR
jgi:hypothetical protein